MQIPATRAGFLYFMGVSKPEATLFPGILIFDSFTPNTPGHNLEIGKKYPYNDC